MKVLMALLFSFAASAAWASETITINFRQGNKVCRYYVEDFKKTGGVTTPSGIGASIFMFPTRDHENNKKHFANGCLNVERFEIHVNQNWLTSNDRMLGNRIVRLLSNGTIDELNFSLAKAKLENQGEMQLITWSLGDPASEQRSTYTSYRQNVTVELRDLTNAEFILEQAR